MRSGDTLWDIAGKTLGSPAQWRRIWRYNNRATVVRITGKGVPNPDLIHPGQVLLIPALPGVRVDPVVATPLPVSPPVTRAPQALSSAPSEVRSPQLMRQPGQPPSADRKLNDELKDLSSPISIKYRLDDMRLPPIVQPGYVLEVRMTGDVLLMSQRTYPALYVTQRKEIEAQVVSQANHAFGALVNDSRLVYDSRQRTLTYRSMLVSQSNVPNSVATAVGVQADTENPIPRLRFEFRYPKLTGAIPPFNYTAIDVKVVVELTPNAVPPAGPSPEALRVPATNWDRVIGAGLVAGAFVLVAGTLVEDFFTAGAGAIDDPASFAAASAGVMRGLQLLRGATIVLPAVVFPAAVQLSVRMSLPNGVLTQPSQ